MDYVAAHPSTAPDALSSLSASVPTDADTSPARARALLGNPALPPADTDTVLSAIAVRLALPAPAARLNSGATLQDAVSSWTGLRGPQAEYLAAALPTLPATLAPALCSAANRDNVPAALTWVLRSRTATAQDRATALRALSSKASLTVRDVAPIADIARHRPDLTAALVPRADDSWTTTVLQGAAHPFETQDSPDEIAARLTAALGARTVDSHLTTSVHLAKSGPRATAVVVELARTDAGRRPEVLAAIAASPVVDPRARASAAIAALGVASSLRHTVDAAHALVLSSAPAPPPLLSSYLQLPDVDVEAVASRTDLHGEHLDALLERARSGLPGLDARLLAALACAPACTPDHLAQIRRVLPAAPGGDPLWSLLVDLAGPGRADPATWATIPMSATRRPQTSTALRRAIHLALRHLLSAPTADAALIQALLVLPLDTMDGTVAEAFELATAIVS